MFLAHVLLANRCKSVERWSLLCKLGWPVFQRKEYPVWLAWLTKGTFYTAWRTIVHCRSEILCPSLVVHGRTDLSCRFRIVEKVAVLTVFEICIWKSSSNRIILAARPFFCGRRLQALFQTEHTCFSCRQSTWPSCRFLSSFYWRGFELHKSCIIDGCYKFPAISVTSSWKASCRAPQLVYTKHGTEEAYPFEDRILMSFLWYQWCQWAFLVP